MDDIRSIAQQNCMGCKLCENLCPVKAISFHENKDGFLYPSIDLNLCIACGKCYNSCIGNPLRPNKIIPSDMNQVFAAWTNDTFIRINSTSGGVYYEMAEHMLKNKGYICAAAFTKGYEGLAHIIGNDQKTVLRTMRSKYFQSDIGNCFERIKELAEQKNQVLFVGSPCQAEALRVYLKKDYENVIICDFICRGVNSPLAYQSFIKGMEEKYRSRIKTVHFKNKGKGWTNLTTHLTFENGREYYGTKYSDPWINGYISGHLFMRESCYHCQYTNTKRYADVTIGDFWGLQEKSKDDDFLGVSCISGNTEKGCNFIRMLSEKIVLHQVNLQEIVEGNGCLSGSQLEIPNQRSEFFEQCNNERFDKLVYRLMNWDQRIVWKRKLKGWLVSWQNRKNVTDVKEYAKLILNKMEDFDDADY